ASFRAHYQSLVASGAIEADAAQAEAAEAFADLEQRLASYTPMRKQGLLGRLFADKDEAPPRGLYIHGEVGRGKTMLMDVFFQHSPVEHKRRAHFHEFMAEVHERIYGFRHNIARGEITDVRLRRRPTSSAAVPVIDHASVKMNGNARCHPRHISLKRRILHVPCSANGVARHSFVDICEKTLATSDYLRLTHDYHTIM